MQTKLKSDKARAAELFHALSDQTRLEIIELLRRGERCVCELTGDLDAAQSRLSFHLKVLKDAGLVTDRKDGRWVHYKINPDALAEIQQRITALEPAKSSRKLEVCCG